MKAAPACFEQQVCHGWCLLCGCRSNCDTQLLEFALFKFFMFKSSGGEGGFININILICEGGREDRSGLAAFNPCCESFSLFLLLSFFPSVFLLNFRNCRFHFLKIVILYCYREAYTEIPI